MVGAGAIGRRLNAVRGFAFTQPENTVVIYAPDRLHRLTLPPLSDFFDGQSIRRSDFPWQATFAQVIG